MFFTLGWMKDFTLFFQIKFKEPLYLCKA